MQNSLVQLLPPKTWNIPKTHKEDYKMGMNLNAQQGDKVVFAHSKNGYPSDQALVKRRLKLRKIYTVAYVDAGRFSSTVRLVEFPKLIFNTVHFEDYHKKRRRAKK